MADANIIQDGDFETISNAWILSSKAAITRGDDPANKFCRLGSTASVLQRVTLEPSVDYVVYFDSKGKTSGLVQIVNAISGEPLQEQEFNVSLAEDWQHEYVTFSGIKAGIPTNLRFNNPWTAEDYDLDIDNVGMGVSEFVPSKPLWVDLGGNVTNNQPFEFQNRDGVAAQTNRLYVDSVLIQEFPDTAANVLYKSTQLFTPANNSAVFKLVAVDVRTNQEYSLFQGTGSQLFAGAAIYL